MVCVWFLRVFPWPAHSRIWFGMKAQEEFSSPLHFQTPVLSGLIITGPRRTDIQEQNFNPFGMAWRVWTKGANESLTISSAVHVLYWDCPFLWSWDERKKGEREGNKTKVKIARPQLPVLHWKINASCWGCFKLHNLLCCLWGCLKWSFLPVQSAMLLDLLRTSAINCSQTWEGPHCCQSEF